MKSETAVCLACGGRVGATPGLPLDRSSCSCGPSHTVSTLACPGCGGPLRVGARSCPHCDSTVATCRCASCLAWNLAGAEFCQACGLRLTADTSASQGPDVLRCPRCTGRLVLRAYADLEVDECDHCGGLFLSPAMLDRVVRSHDQNTGLLLALPQAPLRRESTVKYVHCPICTRLMNRQAFGRISGVVVDVCKSDGVWFDAGEITQVIEFVEHGGLERARQREKDELAEQARKLQGEQVQVYARVDESWQAPRQGESLGNPSWSHLGHEFLAALTEIWRK